MLAIIVSCLFVVWHLPPSLSQSWLLGAGTGEGSCPAPPYRARSVYWTDGCPVSRECCTEFGFCMSSVRPDLYVYNILSECLYFRMTGIERHLSGTVMERAMVFLFLLWWSSRRWRKGWRKECLQMMACWGSPLLGSLLQPQPLAGSFIEVCFTWIWSFNLKYSRKQSNKHRRRIPKFSICLLHWGGRYWLACCTKRCKNC